MNEFKYLRATDESNAVTQLSKESKAKFLGGGTNLIDLIKENIEKPSALVDVSRLALKEIKKTSSGGVSIGATAKNSDTANHFLIRENYPLLSQAILSGASAQIRNMATNGGNLLQRTRCLYFYDTAMRCNKRAPGTGCDAHGGLNQFSAVLGWNEKCVATHPSDMSVALAALDAVVNVKSKDGKTRAIQFADFHRLPDFHERRILRRNPTLLGLETQIRFLKFWQGTRVVSFRHNTRRTPFLAVNHRTSHNHQALMLSPWGVSLQSLHILG